MSSKRMREILESTKQFCSIVVDYHTGGYSDEGDSDEEYSRPDTYTDYWFDGTIRIVPDSGYSNLVVPFIPVKGQTYYLLYAIYSTGDSFGTDHGSNIDFIGLFQDESLAEENEKEVNAATSNFRREGGRVANIKYDDGRVEKHTLPWNDDYFASLDNVSIKRVTLK